MKTPWLAPALCGALFVALAAARVFGHHEAALLKTWMGATAGAAWEKRPVRLRVVRPPRARRRVPKRDRPHTIPLPAADPAADPAEPRRRAA